MKIKLLIVTMVIMKLVMTTTLTMYMNEDLNDSDYADDNNSDSEFCI
jgi:hypothetical protein